MSVHDRLLNGWIGVDLDGTLAYYYKWVRWDSIGAPIPLMRDRVLGWLASGYDVRIVTARVHEEPDPAQCAVSGDLFTRAAMVSAIQDWTERHLGVRLPVTATKDVHMIELWDDRAIQVIPNTGRTLAEEHAAELTALRGKP